MTTPQARPERIRENLFVIRDTCNVYVLRSGREGLAIDFGSGLVLRNLDAMGIDRLSDVLVTHHHRDQVQGLAQAVASGANVWVPPAEQDLFRHADEEWQARRFDNDYEVRQVRNAPLWSVPITGVLPEYRTVRIGEFQIEVLPTPGHTVGSVSFLTTVGDDRVAFTGDLMAAGGKVWSLAATQWTYNGIEGVGATWQSAQDIRDRHPALVLPSHGPVIDDSDRTVEQLAARLMRLISDRGPFRSPDLRELQLWRDQPFVELTPHLLMNRTSISRSYVLLSESGKAMVIDYGYDFSTGLAPAADRTSRRPTLATLASLKRSYGIDRVDVAMPTHYHDDHVAGFNLLREVEGSEVWAAENFADILPDPFRYDLPCLWYDPIPVARTLRFGAPIRWEEYELEVHPLPGHTLYACAISFEVDGVTAIASGDQQGTEPGLPGEFLNYTYRNRFGHRDYRRSAELYRRLGAELLISGHWEPRTVDGAYLDEVLRRGVALEQVHEDLLPLETFDLGAEGAAAWIRPYRSIVAPGATLDLDVEVRNPLPDAASARIRLHIPPTWAAAPDSRELALPARGSGIARFTIRVDEQPGRRVRIASDIDVGDVRLGLAAEALVTVADPASPEHRPLPVLGADAPRA